MGYGITRMAKQPGFTTFSGVYRPVVLTVLGALLYLREGWLVGNAGLGGALLVIGAAYTITGTTALSVASIATNLRLRAGGAFAIISAALGLEAGGAIGVPLFIAQTISSVLYLYAFTEGWGYLFPEHPPVVVVGTAFVGVGLLAWVSARLASSGSVLHAGGCGGGDRQRLPRLGGGADSAGPVAGHVRRGHAGRELCPFLPGGDRHHGGGRDERQPRQPSPLYPPRHAGGLGHNLGGVHGWRGLVRDRSAG